MSGRLARLVAVAAIALAPALVPLLAAPADAQVTGGCTATIDGQDVGSAHSARSAIEVGADDTVTVVGTAPGPITGYQVYLSFAGVRFKAASGTVSDRATSYTTDVKVADYRGTASGSTASRPTRRGPSAAPGPT